MYDTVLIAVDGSDAASHAASQAIELAQLSSAVLHVLHVVEMEPTYTKQGSVILEQERDSEERSAFGEQLTNEIAQQATESGVDVVTKVSSGTPAFVIADYADDIGVDVIVLGYQGRSGLKERVIGSTTERVIRMADTSVLTVH